MEKKIIHFGKNVKYLIKKRGFRQFEFAEKIESKQGTISNWINGLSYPNFDMLLILSNALNISIDALIYTDLENTKNWINSNELDSLSEPQAEYQNISIDTEGVGLLESLIKRVEQLEKEVKELKNK